MAIMYTSAHTDTLTAHLEKLNTQSLLFLMEKRRTKTVMWISVFKIDVGLAASAGCYVSLQPGAKSN